MNEVEGFGSAVAYYNKSKVFEKSYQFSVDVISFCKQLKERKEYEIAGQLLRCGTSIGANIMEASAAYSTREFCYKMSIASKEARESLYWLSLIKDTTNDFELCEGLIKSCQEIIRMLTKIVKSTRLKIKD